jgi:hypothetical protein
MHLSNQAFVGGAGLLAASLCFAQPAVLASGYAASAPAATKAPTKAPTKTPNAATNKHVLEDDNVRIEESRARGEVQSITVQSKVPGVPGYIGAYNIVPLAARKDPSQEGGAAGSAGVAGKRTWSLLDF